MKIFLIGSGGREHALAWRLKQNPKVQLFSAPGSSALAALGDVHSIATDDIKGLINLATEIKPDLTIIGPELPLVLGLADELRKNGFLVFGPSATAARIEGSKTFAKDFMVRHNIPTASYAVFYDQEEAQTYLERTSYPIVLKADGLANGKGVAVCGSMESALIFLKEISALEAGKQFIIEEYLAGEEVSFFALTDGKTVLPFQAAQDHKTIFDADRGPNTGGMGAYSPSPIISKRVEDIIMDTIIIPAVEGLAIEGAPFNGILFAGLMITLNGPKLLEFNARFGDPETQVLMPRLKTDLADICLATAQGNLKGQKLEWDERSSVCVVMAAKGYPGTYQKGDEIKGLEIASKREGINIFEAGTARKITEEKGEKSTKVLTNGGRVLGVTATADDITSAITKVYQAAADITFEGAHYRKDIASKALHKNLLYPETAD
jgi:phosphoribosylamine--glycine ligase